MRERREQAHGPYQRGRRWRVIETSATGARSTCSFASEAEALEYIASFNDEAEGRTLSAVIDAYRDDMKLRIKPLSVKTNVYRLHGILGDVKRDRLLSAVTPAMAQQMYAARIGVKATDTHHAELAIASLMFTWCIERGWLKVNPFATVKPVGRKNRRSAKLRIDEVRKLVTLALAEGTSTGVAVVMPVLMGLRATEVTSRRCRDVDNGGRILWIEDAKTAAGERHLEVPTARLRKRLAELVFNRQPDDLLFGDVDRHWLGYHVRRLCEAADIPVVSPHALRRSWSSISSEAAPVDQVSRAMGHASAAITRRHYVVGGPEERRRTAAVERAVERGERKLSGRVPVSAPLADGRGTRKVE